MSVRRSSFNHSERLLLRWSDNPNSPSREEFVQMLETHFAEAVIRSSLHVGEMTKVYLIGKSYREMGVVRSCCQDGAEFIVTIGIGSEIPRRPAGSDRDPGVLLIDDYVTEEQERQILGDLDKELSCESHRDAAPAKQLPNLSLGERAEVLQRFFGGTAGVSSSSFSSGIGQFWGKCRQLAGTCAQLRPQERQAAHCFCDVIPNKPPATPGYIQ